jgi:hypothetical protein
MAVLSGPAQGQEKAAGRHFAGIVGDGAYFPIADAPDLGSGQDLD